LKISDLPSPSNEEKIIQQSINTLRRYWGFESFRGIQQDIILSICSGKDTLALMPTGGGKSIAFQVPSLMMDGVCIVITPLIALMKDQVQHLRDINIKATAVYSGMTRSEVLDTYDKCILGNYKFLYLSPERLSSDLFQAKLAHMRVNFICVDEAHCISQWGYDFRPSYLQISLIRKLCPQVPILALTATATPRVVKDIQYQLKFRQENVFRMSFERKNLAYIVQSTNSKENTVLDLLKHTEGSAIIYTRNRDQTHELAKFLTKHDITALHYHAGLDNADKDARQQLWQDNLVRVMVSTNAFGMGIDKPDVRMVIHIGVPDSLEAYFQEAGRAGRDGKFAKAILLRGPYEVSTLKRHVDTEFPAKEYISKVYEDICYFYQLAVGDGDGLRREFSMAEFCKAFKYFPVPVMSAFRILEHAGYLKYSEPEDCVSCCKIVVNRNDLYKLQHLSGDTEKVLQTLLRTYNGLFVDLMPIEELLLAQRSGMSPEEVYRNLRILHMIGVLYYVPFKNIAHITFMQRRVETRDLIYSKEVYELRRMELVQRVDAVINYLTTESTCRSRLLLEYFGQKDAGDCGQCDVCISNGYARNETTSQQSEKASEAIVGLLADGEAHSFTQLLALPFSRDTLKQSIEILLNQGEVEYIDGRFKLA